MMTSRGDDPTLNIDSSTPVPIDGSANVSRGTSETVHLDGSPATLKTISVGADGEVLLQEASTGRQTEIRTLNRAPPDRIEGIKQQLELLSLVQHPSIRSPLTPITTGESPSFKYSIPDGIDIATDRLPERLAKLSNEHRFQIAASIVDATTAAHRVGLYHGTFDPSSMLIGIYDDRAIPFIDFSTMRCSAESAEPVLTLENDLVGVLDVIRALVSQVLDASDQSSQVALGGRQRAIVRQWLKANDPSELPPTLGQWRSTLSIFLEPNASTNKTNVLGSPAMLIGTGSTNRIGPADGSTDNDSLVNKQIGRFQIDAKIGEGGMGTVYRGTDLANGQVVAIKVLRRTGKDIARHIRRFRKEARLLGDVQNEFVTRLIDVGEDNGTHFLAMEYVRGLDLKQWLLGRSGLPEQEALSIAADLARSLVDAHANEVIHRDIKPENILLKFNDDIAETTDDWGSSPIRDFTLKLTDFGIARHVNQSESMEMTHAGAVIGTPRYMSPEQCKSTGELTPAADVYSIGITLYELLTGEVPYLADDYMKLAAMHCFDAVPSPQKKRAEISDATDRLVQRALAKSPSDRFGDASQFLAEILRLTRGDAESIKAHPKLPAQHQSAKVWSKTVTWDLKSDSAELWPLVSNTERLNEAIGLPAVTYRTEKDPERGLRKFGSFSLSGVKVSWEEHPFEWVEGQRMGILREFDKGPFKWFLSIVTLTKNSVGGTQLSHQIKIEPRNFFGRVLTTIEADWKGFRNLDKVYRRMDRSIQGRLAASEGDDPFEKVTPMSRHQRARLQRRIGRVIDQGVPSSVANSIAHCLENWSAQDIAQLRPLAMADRLAMDGDQMINACLTAAAQGILTLQWDILCPTCRVSASSSDKFSEIQTHTHCEACDVDFQSNLASAIEMVFQAHPEIRDVNTGQYCIGGPEHSPHVVAQIRVEPDECVDVSLDLDVGDYLIRGPQLPRTQTIRVHSTAAPSMMDVILSTLGSGTHTPKLRSGRQTLTFRNDTPSLKVIRVERLIPRGDVVTAAMASANPTFRRLFPNQKFSTSNPIDTENLTFLVTSVNNIEELYTSLGDADAYKMIQDHQALLSTAVTSSAGTVVKTIGEKMLAVFNRCEDALLACQRARDALADLTIKTNDDDAAIDMPLMLGVGIHSGPTMVTTQNNQLDYFGATVRAASSLPDFADGDTLLSETVYRDPSATDWLPSLREEVESIRLPGVPEQRVKRITH